MGVRMKIIVVTKPEVDQVVFEGWLNSQPGVAVIDELNRLPRHYLVATSEPLPSDPRILYAIPADAEISTADTAYAPTPTEPKWHTGRVTKRFPWPFFTPKEATFQGGAGANVFVIDTGIDTTHAEFGGKAQWLWAFDGREIDDHSHGTHCAGNVHMLAPETTIYAVKVLGANGGGTLEWFLTGIDRVVEHHKTSGRASVASMSLAFVGTVPWLTEVLCSAIRTLMDVGVIVVAAAGNNAQPLSDIEVYPAEASEVVTVGATDFTRESIGLIWPDERAQFSNYGIAVDIYAPGVGIWSYAPGGGWARMDGTSMATPLVAGALAKVVKRCSNNAEVRSEVEAFYATQPRRRVRDVRGSFNRFLYAPN